jgi:carboxyl-terminal processing protease
VVGETTFGKGSVQNVMQLPDGSALRFTTAKYYTPSKQVIHGNGVVPNIRVPINPEQERLLFAARSSGDTIRTIEDKNFIKSNDPQMLRAIDALKGVMIYAQQNAIKPEAIKK